MAQHDDINKVVDIFWDTYESRRAAAETLAMIAMLVRIIGHDNVRVLLSESVEMALKAPNMVLVTIPGKVACLASCERDTPTATAGDRIMIPMDHLVTALRDARGRVSTPTHN